MLRRRSAKNFNIFRNKSCHSGATKMSGNGAFAVLKTHQNDEKKKIMGEAVDLSPPKYSGKFMNSIWGMYNRYSVHNLKKNMDQRAISITKENLPREGTTIEFQRSLSTNNLLTGFL